MGFMRASVALTLIIALFQGTTVLSLEQDSNKPNGPTSNGAFFQNPTVHAVQSPVEPKKELVTSGSQKEEVSSDLKSSPSFNVPNHVVFPSAVTVSAPKNANTFHVVVQKNFHLQPNGGYKEHFHPPPPPVFHSPNVFHTSTVTYESPTVFQPAVSSSWVQPQFSSQFSPEWPGSVQFQSAIPSEAPVFPEITTAKPEEFATASYANSLASPQSDKQESERIEVPKEIQADVAPSFRHYLKSLSNEELRKAVYYLALAHQTIKNEVKLDYDIIKSMNEEYKQESAGKVAQNQNNMVVSSKGNSGYQTPPSVVTPTLQTVTQLGEVQAQPTLKTLSILSGLNTLGARERGVAQQQSNRNKAQSLPSLPPLPQLPQLQSLLNALPLPMPQQQQRPRPPAKEPFIRIVTEPMHAPPPRPQNAPPPMPLQPTLLRQRPMPFGETPWVPMTSHRGPPVQVFRANLGTVRNPAPVYGPPRNIQELLKEDGISTVYGAPMGSPPVQPEKVRNGGYGPPEPVRNGGYGPPEPVRSGGYGAPEPVRNGGYGAPEPVRNAPPRNNGNRPDAIVIMGNSAASPGQGWGNTQDEMSRLNNLLGSIFSNAQNERTRLATPNSNNQGYQNQGFIRMNLAIPNVPENQGGYRTIQNEPQQQEPEQERPASPPQFGDNVRSNVPNQGNASPTPNPLDLLIQSLNQGSRQLQALIPQPQQVLQPLEQIKDAFQQGLNPGNNGNGGGAMPVFRNTFIEPGLKNTLGDQRPVTGFIQNAARVTQEGISGFQNLKLQQIQTLENSANAALNGVLRVVEPLTIFGRIQTRNTGGDKVAIKIESKDPEVETINVIPIAEVEIPREMTSTARPTTKPLPGDKYLQLGERLAQRVEGFWKILNNFSVKPNSSSTKGGNESNNSNKRSFRHSRRQRPWNSNRPPTKERD